MGIVIDMGFHTKPLGLRWGLACPSLWLAALGLACGVSAWGQTNFPAAPAKAFSLPAPQLKPYVAQPSPVPPVKRVVPETSRLSAEIAAAKATAEHEAELLAQLDRVIVPPASIAGPQTLVEKGFSEIFDSDRYSIGHVVVGSSLTTAISKRNPLCLLNPVFFWMSF
jgi:hypothetical protein